MSRRPFLATLLASTVAALVGGIWLAPAPAMARPADPPQIAPCYGVKVAPPAQPKPAPSKPRLRPKPKSVAPGA